MCPFRKAKEDPLTKIEKTTHAASKMRPIKLRLRPEVVLHRLNESLKAEEGNDYEGPFEDSRKTLDQTVYAALRYDLDEKHHVDMVFSYYNEAAERVEYTADCHKIALAAKSPVIRQLLLQHQCTERCGIINFLLLLTVMKVSKVIFL